jgi:hypothetical protein
VESCTDDRNNLSELLIGGYRTTKTIVAASDSICFDALQESIDAALLTAEVNIKI